MKNAGRLKNCLLKQGFPSDKAAEAISFFKPGREAVRYLMDAGDSLSNRKSRNKTIVQTCYGDGRRFGHHRMDTPEKVQSRKQGKDTDDQPGGGTH